LQKQIIDEIAPYGSATLGRMLQKTIVGNVLALNWGIRWVENNLLTPQLVRTTFRSIRKPDLADPAVPSTASSPSPAKPSRTSSGIRSGTRGGRRVQKKEEIEN
jgi:hypothetical protein